MSGVEKRTMGREEDQAEVKGGVWGGGGAGRRGGKSVYEGAGRGCRDDVPEGGKAWMWRAQWGG